MQNFALRKLAHQLARMPPEQRERELARLSPEQRKRVLEQKQTDGDF